MSEKLSESRVNELLEAEAKLKKVQERSRRVWQRRNARLMLQSKWAEEKGYVPSAEEIDEYLKSN